MVLLDLVLIKYGFLQTPQVNFTSLRAELPASFPKSKRDKSKHISKGKSTSKSRNSKTTYFIKIYLLEAHLIHASDAHFSQLYCLAKYFELVLYLPDILVFFSYFYFSQNLMLQAHCLWWQFLDLNLLKNLLKYQEVL